MANSPSQSRAKGEAPRKAESPRPDSNVQREKERVHDHKLDQRLEETFPASDPASASPGSD
jgi:hypothetical protein